MHNCLFRYSLAEHGIDPDTDVQIRAVPPPEMVANLPADDLDGFLGPDPMNQRAVYGMRISIGIAWLAIVAAEML